MSQGSSLTLQLPASKESEMMVLGCMLTNINALNIAADQLEEGDFYYSEHRIIFQVLQKAHRDDTPADLHLVAEELKRRDQLQSAGGIDYLATLAQFAGTYAHIEEYVALVRNKATLRRMIQTAQTIEREASKQPDDVSTALDNAQQLFYKIGMRAHSKKGVLIGDVLAGTESESGVPFLEELQKRQEKYQERGPDDPGVTGIQSGFMDLDK
ncbi:MAG: replicative DNA helicase, partial [Chlamydiia bacterium]|nr:replicative DNA helicase [Chlamydiia bacterium]